MLSVFDGLRGVTTLSVFVRLACALICGGIIGIERSYKRRPAGFRTHILICIGAAITTLTSQYLYLNMHYFTDMARLGAQVVAGIGFIGAGTIIVTKRQSAPMAETPTAPDDSVYGRVTDTKGQPIIAATVTIEGSQKGTLTGADGTFELTEVTFPAQLNISYLGYITQTATIEQGGGESSAQHRPERV